MMTGRPFLRGTILCKFLFTGVKTKPVTVYSDNVDLDDVSSLSVSLTGCGDYGRSRTWLGLLGTET